MSSAADASNGARQTRRYSRKREQILGAAATLFNTHGMRGATLFDVAQRVDLITTSITYYYKKKEDLAAACYEATLEALNVVLEEAEAASDPEARIRRFFVAYFRMLAEIAHGKRPELVNFYELRGFTGAHAQELLQSYEMLFRRVRRLIRADGADRLSRLENNARTHLFFSVLLYARTWVRRYDADDYERAGERVCDLLLEGLGGEGARWAPQALADPAHERGPVSEPGPDAFLHVATQLINEQGYHGASVEKIAARLNVTKGSFYHHIEAKDDLVVECFQRSFTTIRNVQRAAMDLPADGWTQLSSSVAELVRYQLSESGPLLRYMALAAAPEAMRADLFAGMQRLADRFASIIVDGIADGSIRPVDPSIVGIVLNGMTNAASDLLQWAPGIDADSAPALYARPLFDGLLKP